MGIPEAEDISISHLEHVSPIAIGTTDCRRGAPVDRGSCPNITCLPSKNEILNSIGGVVSPQKRFFTKRYDQNRLWYTEGGTHGAEVIWWVRDGPNGDWIRFRG